MMAGDMNSGGGGIGIGQRSTTAFVAHEVMLSASMAMATLVVLFIVYDGIYNLHLPSPRQLAIGVIPQMAFVSIWRHYIYDRLHHPKTHPREREPDNHFLHQLLPYWYAASCVVLAFGNCLLPLQFVFGDDQLRPETGDPYPLGMACAICHAFVDVLLGLNLMIDAANWTGKKIARWTNIPWFGAAMLNVDRRIRQFRAPVTFLLSAKIVLGGVMIASEDPVVVNVTVPIRQLPESLDGFRIIQVSDLHVGVSVGRARVERAVKIVNDLCTSRLGHKNVTWWH